MELFRRDDMILLVKARNGEVLPRSLKSPNSRVVSIGTFLPSDTSVATDGVRWSWRTWNRSIISSYREVDSMAPAPFFIACVT